MTPYRFPPLFRFARLDSKDSKLRVAGDENFSVGDERDQIGVPVDVGPCAGLKSSELLHRRSREGIGIESV